MLDVTWIESEIRDQFLDEDENRPWIIGFSGGKDSTLLLQVVWNAVKALPREIRHSRDIWVVCNDTLVENPRIVDFIERTLKKVQQAAVDQDMPVRVAQTTPSLEDTFWVNLIGKGYPAPGSVFRWCTERLKINPTSRFILEKINKHGEAIILLGTRSDESKKRAASMNSYERKGKRLRRHVLPNAWVFAAIKDVKTNELWQYLMQARAPWGGTHKELVALYKNANGGDCPLVIDKTTPSCGNSRFGCWVCTVVKKDKSMEGLIENGEEWMLPLVEFRDWLVYTKENPATYRQKQRRNGETKENAHGPYFPQYRAEMLERVLKAQKEIQEGQGDITLINPQELVAIQITWYRDGIFNYRVSDIYNNIYNSGVNMSKQEEKIRQEEDLLKESCKSDAEFNLLQDLLKLHKTKTLMLKKRGLQNDIEQRITNFVEAKPSSISKK